MDAVVSLLPEAVDSAAEFNWIFTHPVMRRVANTLPSRVIGLTTADVLSANGLAPSKHAVEKLFEWANNPAKFFASMLSPVIDPKAKSDLSDWSAESADVARPTAGQPHSVGSYRDAMLSLPLRADHKVEIDWIRSHPALAKLLGDRSLSSVPLTAEDIVTDDGIAPSQAAALTVQFYSSHPVDLLKDLAGDSQKPQECFRLLADALDRQAPETLADLLRRESLIGGALEPTRLHLYLQVTSACKSHDGCSGSWSAQVDPLEIDFDLFAQDADVVLYRLVRDRLDKLRNRVSAMKVAA
jgi:hypothetical protein